MIKKILIGSGATLVLLAGAVFIIPTLVPTDTYRDKLESELSRMLMRDVSITGDIKISTFPAIAINAGEVTLANPEGYGAPNFISVDSLSAKVKLWPLLSKTVDISQISLDQPDIWLERKSNGDVNWSVGDTKPETTPEPSDDPFRRDGRFTDFNPALNLLQIDGGRIEFTDATSDQNILLESVNLKLRAPGLDKTLKLDGDAIFDGLNVALETSLESPLDFLNGEETPMEASIQTDFVSVDITGQFRASEDIDFDAKFDVSTSDPSALLAKLPVPETVILPQLNSVSAKGSTSFVQGNISVSDVDAKIIGNALDLEYTGDVGLGETISADGTFATKVSDTSIINPYLETPIPALNAISTLNAAGQIKMAGQVIDISDLSAKASGDLINLSFDGSAGINDDVQAAGTFNISSSDIPTLVKTVELEKPVPALDAIEKLDAAGKIQISGKNIDVTDLSAKASGALIDLNFDGSAGVNDGVRAAGTFDMSSSDVPALVQIAGLDQPDATALKKLTANGTLSLEGDSFNVTNLKAVAADGTVNGSYEGDIGYAKTLTLSGQAKANIPDLTALDAALTREIPYSDVVKRVEFSTAITTQNRTYLLSDTVAKLEGGDLNASFNGGLAFGDNPDIAGTLALNVPSIRTLATKTGTVLPADTELGPIFQGLDLSGAVSGTPNLLRFQNGQLSLDEISGQGDFEVKLGNSRPMLTGNISLAETNLSPYLAAWSAQRPQGEILPWSTAPINLDGLNAVDAELNFNAASLQFTRLGLGQTSASLSLKNGVLNTDIKGTELYNGTAAGSLTLSAPQGQPRLSINTKVENVEAQNLMGAMGGFEKVTGTTDFNMSINGSGQSQSAIMKSLSGSGTFNVLNGKLLGVDAESLLTGIDTAVASQQLPAGLGLGDTTEFTDLEGRFTVTGGRVELSTFQLQAGNFSMEGDGEIDLGGQSLDVGIRPKLSEGSDVASFGVPIRFKGPFGQAKPGLDTNMLAQIAQAKARAAAGDAIKDRVGGTLGGILGGVIGGTPQTTTQTETTTQSGTAATATSTDTETEETPSTEDLVIGGLKGLFGKKN